MTMVNVKVLFEYDAEQPDELSLNVGEVVRNVAQQDGGWWEGELNGKRGMFPENFVEVIKEDGAAAPAPAAALAPAAATPSASAAKKKARVAFQYDPEQDDELALEVGNVIDILEQEDEGWWKGSAKGKVGMFPSNFVELIKDDTAPSLPDPAEPEKAGNANRPKSQLMGFGLKLEDLSRNKLKKVEKSSEPKDEPKKPVQMVPPLDHGKRDIDKKLPSIPPSAQKMVTKSVQKAKVIFVYEPEEEDELKLAVGDIVTITNKDVFEGWMEGELRGKTGLFPDNFVELLPVENIKVDGNLNVSKEINTQKSVRRAAKENPVKAGQPTRPQGIPLSPLKKELEKKTSVPPAVTKPPPPMDSKKPQLNKSPAPPPPAAKKPKPALPQQPKPAKPPAPAPKLSDPTPSPKLVGETPRSSSISGENNANRIPSLPRSEPESIHKKGKDLTEPLEPHKDNKSDPSDIDLDSVKPTDPLKHIQRAKPPSKNPPSKFKDVQSAGVDDVDGVSPSKEVIELKSQVTDLQSKLVEMEKKFKKLVMQVTEDLDNERKNRLNQQVEIDRLKKQINLLTDH